MLAAMTPDLWALAVFTVLCAAGVGAFGIAEHQRFTDSRPAPRHRAPLSRLELAAMFREFLYEAGWWCAGMLGAAVLAFVPLVELLHLRDRRSEREHVTAVQ